MREHGTQRTVVRVENTLIKCGKFKLPGKKKLSEPNMKFEVIIVDVSEITIEKPKKTEEILFGKEENAYN